MVRSTGVGGFISPQNGNFRCKKLEGDLRRCYILLLFFLDLFRKEEGKYTVTLINGSSLIPQRIQHKVVLLVVLTIFAGGF